MDLDNFRLLFKAIVRPQLGYINAVWSPKRKKNITMVENVQRRTTSMVPGLNDPSYPERLKCLKLPTLTYRHLHGDMIETFKIIRSV